MWVGGGKFLYWYLGQNGHHQHSIWCSSIVFSFHHPPPIVKQQLWQFTRYACSNTQLFVVTYRPTHPPSLFSFYLVGDSKVSSVGLINREGPPKFRLPYNQNWNVREYVLPCWKQAPGKSWRTVSKRIPGSTTRVSIKYPVLTSNVLYQETTRNISRSCNQASPVEYLQRTQRT